MNEIELWDGKTYDRKVLERRSSLLVSYAESHRELTEVLLQPDAPPLKVLAWIPVIVFAAGLINGITAAIVPGAGGFMGGFRESTLVFLLISFLYLLPFLMDRASDRETWPRPTYPQTISVENGVFGFEMPLGSAGFRLRDCRWFRGFPHHGARSSSCRACASMQRCIIIHPKGCSRAFACGLSEEMYEIWSTFLTVAEVPESRPRSRAEGPLVAAAAILGYAAASCITSVLYVWLGDSLGMTGTMYYLKIMVPAVGMMYASVLAGSDWFAVEQRLAYEQVATTFALVASFFFAWGSLPNIPLYVGCIAASAAAGCLVTWDLGRRGRVLVS